MPNRVVGDLVTEVLADPAAAAVASGREGFERRLLAAHRLRQRKLRTQRIGLGAGVPLFGFALWEVLTKAGVLDSTFFPAPTSILVDMWQQVRTSSGFDLLASSLGLTMRDTALGFVIGAAIGVVAGLAMGISRPLFSGFGPIVFGTFPTPKIALYPLFLVIFGLGSSSSVALAATSSFYLVCINTLTGVRFSAPVFGEVGLVFSVPRLLRYLRIVGPAASPSIITGLRLGLSESLVVVLAVEFIGSTAGMGAYIWNAWQILEVGQMFTGLFVTMLVGGAVILAGNLLERIAVPWQQD